MSFRRQRQSSRSNRKPSRGGLRQGGRRRGVFESLEDRLVLSVSSSLADGVVSISMNNADDTAVVQIENGSLVVREDGSVRSAFLASAVDRIEVTGDGNANQRVVFDPGPGSLSLTDGLDVSSTVEVTEFDSGAITNTGVGQAIRVDSASILLSGGDITTDGGDILLAAPITLTADTLLDSDEVGGSVDAGDIEIGDVNVGTGAARSLTIDANADGGASGGDVEFGSVGDVKRLASFDLSTTGGVNWAGEEIKTDGGDVRLVANVLQTSTALPSALQIDTETGGDQDAGNVTIDTGLIIDTSVIGLALIQINTAAATGFQTGNVSIPTGFTQLGPSGSSVAYKDVFNNRLLVNRTAFEAAFADFGDAPASYKTLLADDGARHLTLNNSVLLGSLRDNDVNVQPGANADGDDTQAVDDEDGVAFISGLAAGTTAQVSVTLSAAGFLDGWIDYDLDGEFDSDEHINAGTSLTLAAGTQTINVPIPATAASGTSYARFRVSSTGGLAPTGLAVDGEVEDYQVALNPGAGPEINLQSGAADVLHAATAPSVGSTDVGTSLTQTFTVQNNGTAPLDLNGGTIVAVGGANAGDFVVTTPPDATIPIGGTSDFVVTFTPSAVGTRTATLTIANNDPTDGEDPYVITLEGDGIAVVPEINIRQNATDVPSGTTAPNFGSVSVGSNAQNTFELQNTGNGVLNLTAGGPTLITVSGPQAAEFVVDQPASSSVAPMSDTSFNITFTPTAAGVRTATVSIQNDDADEDPYTFTVTGTAVAPEIVVEVEGTNFETGVGVDDFGSTATPVTRTVTVTNSGTDTLNLTGTPVVSVSGANASDFAATTPADLAIAPSGSTTFDVTFTPTNNGLRTATISIANNDGDETPFTIAVQGVGSGFSTALPFNEDFDDGSADPLLDTESGTFNVVANEYEATRTQGINAITTIDLGTLPTEGVTISTTVNAGAATSTSFSNAFIVFDYQDDDNFKVAGIEVKNDRLVIAQVVGGVYTRLASTTSTFAADVDHTLSVTVTSTDVEVTANGSAMTTAMLTNPLDGKIGVGTINADSVFDDIMVTTP